MFWWPIYNMKFKLVGDLSSVTLAPDLANQMYKYPQTTEWWKESHTHKPQHQHTDQINHGRKKIGDCTPNHKGPPPITGFFFFKRTMFVWEGRGSALVHLEENRHLLDLPRGWASLGLLIDFQALSCTGSDILDVHVPLWIIVGWVWESKSLLWVCRRLLQSRITISRHH